MSPVFDRHEVVINELPAGQRFTHQALCDCNWQGSVDGVEAAEGLAQGHQAARGYVPQDKEHPFKLNKLPVAAKKEVVEAKPAATDKDAGLAAKKAVTPVAPSVSAVVGQQNAAKAVPTTTIGGGHVVPAKTATNPVPQPPATPVTPKPGAPVVNTPAGPKVGDEPVK